MSRPVHEHDCERCRFLGNHVSDTGIVNDVYRSCDSRFQEYIMRFSSDGPDYRTVIDGAPLWNVCQRIEGGH